MLLSLALVAGCAESSTNDDLDALRSEVSELRQEIARGTAVPTTTTPAAVDSLANFWNFTMHPDHHVSWCSRYRNGESRYLYGLAVDWDYTIYTGLTMAEFKKFFDAEC